ncbi:MAG: DoxX family membrane protein [Melioribacteraceae bacterium]|nr:DoxX family membrane protein [Melioribacteraceae bacterium]
MEIEKNSYQQYSKFQLTTLVVLRMLIGWHFLYEGIVKLLDPDWSAAGYLNNSQWWFAEFFKWLASDPLFLGVVNFLNIWGLILIGVGLIAGLFTKEFIIGGIILLTFYYLSMPPMPGVEYAMPMEGHYIIVNKTLIELVALFVLIAFPTGKEIGIDRLIMLLKLKSK